MKHDDLSNLVGEVKFDIFDHSQFYKFFPVPKRSKLFSNIKFYFTFNLISSEFLIDRIHFLDDGDNILQSKQVDDYVEDNYEKRFKFSNKVLFKILLKQR